MTLTEIKEKWQKNYSGGDSSSDTKSRFGDELIEFTIAEYRAKAIWNSWQRTKRTNPVWYQRSELIYDKTIQEVPRGNKPVLYIKFEMPEIISLDGYQDGLRYFGDISGTQNFSRLDSLEMANISNSQRISQLNNSILIQYTYTNGMAYVWGNKGLRVILTNNIFMNPVDVTVMDTTTNTARAFDPDNDIYPISPDILADMDILVRYDLGLEQKVNPDLINNSAPNPVR